MKIHTAPILCAGFGKRLNPITINTPKPLLIFKDLTLLDHCINLIIKLNIKKVLINISSFAAYLLPLVLLTGPFLPDLFISIT